MYQYIGLLGDFFEKLEYNRKLQLAKCIIEQKKKKIFDDILVRTTSYIQTAE